VRITMRISQEATMRLLTALTLVTLAFIASAPAQESRSTPPPPSRTQASAEWQAVITKQIVAFRSADAAAALSCAGVNFRDAFKDPVQFYEFIVNSEYQPIVKSRSHSFGEFQRGEGDNVLQIVTITGADQRVYKAIYEMTREEEGWKVQGVTRLIAESIVT
jgi:hypothetical protein